MNKNQTCRDFMKTIAMTSAGVNLAHPLRLSVARQTPPPNIVLIMADD